MTNTANLPSRPSVNVTGSPTRVDSYPIAFYTAKLVKFEQYLPPGKEEEPGVAPQLRVYALTTCTLNKQILAAVKPDAVFGEHVTLPYNLRLKVEMPSIFKREGFPKSLRELEGRTFVFVVAQKAGAFTADNGNTVGYNDHILLNVAFDLKDPILEQYKPNGMN